jgi:epoxyqueuosine reductase
MAGELSRADLKRLCVESGLAVAGVTGPEPFLAAREYLTEHINRGHLAGMEWFTGQRAIDATDPRVLHSSMRSIVAVALPFWSGPARPPDDGILRGRIARYAWGRDYHDVLRRRMRTLVVAIEQALGRRVEARTLVDTARIVDRAVAARAGAGWYGKNSMIIVPGHGSWVMLGELLLDIDLPRDLPLERDCGRCAICFARCPTGAIIEDVCPYTAAARVTDDPDFQPRTLDNAFPSLEFLARMSETEFRAAYSGTPVTRAKRAGLSRNAAVALGNSADPRAEPILRWMLSSHDEPLARGHAAWALGRLCGAGARPALDRARRTESDKYVVSEIEAALAMSA